MRVNQWFSTKVGLAPLLILGVVTLFSGGLSPRTAAAGEGGHQHQMGGHPEGHGHTGGGGGTINVPAAFRESLTPLYQEYFNLHHALSSEDLSGATKAFSSLGKAVGGVEMEALKGKAHEAWMEEAMALKKQASAGAAAGDLAMARESFAAVSTTVIEIDKKLGHKGNEARFVLFCPMALNKKGASWLQASEEVSNPYMGGEMKRCGELKELLPK